MLLVTISVGKHVRSACACMCRNYRRCWLVCVCVFCEKQAEEGVREFELHVRKKISGGLPMRIFKQGWVLWTKQCEFECYRKCEYVPLNGKLFRNDNVNGISMHFPQQIIPPFERNPIDLFQIHQLTRHYRPHRIHTLGQSPPHSGDTNDDRTHINQ